jgi:type III secretion protein V
VHGGVEQLALDPGQVSQLMTYLKTLIEQHRPAAIVTAVDIRRHVRKLIEPDCFSTPVLSYHELVPSLQLEVLARLGGEGAPRLTG